MINQIFCIVILSEYPQALPTIVNMLKDWGLCISISTAVICLKMHPADRILFQKIFVFYIIFYKLFTTL